MSEILGWTATILFTFCYVPQMVKTVKSKTVVGLSFWLLGIAFIANVIALVYATMIDQSPLQVKYILGIIADGVCIYLFWRYRE